MLSSKLSLLRKNYFVIFFLNKTFWYIRSELSQDQVPFNKALTTLYTSDMEHRFKDTQLIFQDLDLISFQFGRIESLVLISLTLIKELGTKKIPFPISSWPTDGNQRNLEISQSLRLARTTSDIHCILSQVEHVLKNQPLKDFCVPR